MKKLPEYFLNPLIETFDAIFTIGQNSKMLAKNIQILLAATKAYVA